ncbi:MAG: type I secretion system permease/ATPase [Tabrizicola sp.]|nr:type I secretion system permease/ATPase [Tabrizicola sp.]
MQNDVREQKNPYRVVLRDLRRTFIQVGLFSAAINFLMLTGPVYMLQVYDRVLSSGSVPTLQGLFIIVVVLYAFLGIYEFLRARLLSRAGYRLDAIVGNKAFDHAMNHSGEADRGGENPLRDLDVVRGFLASPAILGIFDAPWIPFFLIIVFFIHPLLGWLTLFGAIIVTIAAYLNQMVTKRAIYQAVALESAERNFVDKSRRTAEVLFAMGMRSVVTNAWRNMHNRGLAYAQLSGERSEAFSAFSKSFRLLLQSMLLTLGAYLAIKQEVSPGAIIATTIIAGRALAPVDQVIGQWKSIGRTLQAHRSLLTTLDDMKQEDWHIALPAPKGELQVSNLTKYAPTAFGGQARQRILSQVSFALSPGDGLGVIGNSAAGKSSLAKVLVGAWRADSGEVRLDGAALDQWNPEHLGQHIGYLPQSLEMLPGTIAENISRFNPNASDKDIVDAAQIAGVHEMILAFPNGYSTLIGTPLQPLSGGQVQRLGLARAIFGMPRLIILDEPNSNLDGGGDDALSEAILTLRNRGSVVIVMAHRPSVIHSVNKVMILHKGQIAQFGNKEDIIQMATRPVPAEAVSR